jgi:hypothetical protein
MDGVFAKIQAVVSTAISSPDAARTAAAADLAKISTVSSPNLTPGADGTEGGHSPTDGVAAVAVSSVPDSVAVSHVAVSHIADVQKAPPAMDIPADAKMDVPADAKVDVPADAKVYVPVDGKMDVPADGKMDGPADVKVDDHEDLKMAAPVDPKLDVQVDVTAVANLNVTADAKPNYVAGVIQEAINASAKTEAITFTETGNISPTSHPVVVAESTSQKEEHASPQASSAPPSSLLTSSTSPSSSLEMTNSSPFGFAADFTDLVKKKGNVLRSWEKGWVSKDGKKTAETNKSSSNIETKKDKAREKTRIWKACKKWKDSNMPTAEIEKKKQDILASGLFRGENGAYECAKMTGCPYQHLTPENRAQNKRSSDFNLEGQPAPIRVPSIKSQSKKKRNLSGPPKPPPAALYGVKDIVEVLENGNWCASQVLEVADDGAIKVSFYLYLDR